MKDKTKKGAFEEIEKLSKKLGLEDEFQKARYQSLLELYKERKFSINESIIVMMLLNEKEFEKSYLKCISFIKTLNDVSDDLTKKDFERKLSKDIEIFLQTIGDISKLNKDEEM